METIRDKLLSLPGEIITFPKAIKIKLSNKIKNEAIIMRLLKKQRKLLAGKTA